MPAAACRTRRPRCSTTGEELKVETLEGRRDQAARSRPWRADSSRHRSRRDLVSRREARGNRPGCGSRKPTPIPAATCSKATNWSGIARSAGRATQSCCRVGWTVVASSIPGGDFRRRRGPSAPLFRERATRRDPNSDSRASHDPVGDWPRADNRRQHAQFLLISALAKGLTRMRQLSADQHQQQRLLRVQPVLGLIEHHRQDDSITSSVTSSPRCAGRQCMKMRLSALPVPSAPR